MVFSNWNPWVKDRLTVPKTFNKILKLSGKKIMVDPDPDVFISSIPDRWVEKLYNNLLLSKNTFFIPTTHPSNIPDQFLALPNVWIGLKINKNNLLNLDKYSDIDYDRKWVYIKNYEDTSYIKEIFRCPGEEHLIGGTFWNHVYPCTTCNGTGVYNKYNLKWLVFSGHKNGVPRDVVGDYQNKCDQAGIPFYYMKAWIKGKLIREPILYDRQFIELPKFI